LMKLWIFGEAHGIPLLQNEIIDSTHKKLSMDANIPLASLQYLYEHISPTSSFRLYYIEALARMGLAVNHIARDHVGLWPRAALIDVMRIMWVAGGDACSNADFRAWDLGQYYVHDDGTKCK
ncbi:hypothetical protein DOTSEDRAFT_127999, partial [Dothistroma septosporum NZE10]